MIFISLNFLRARMILYVLIRIFLKRFRSKTNLKKMLQLFTNFYILAHI